MQIAVSYLKSNYDKEKTISLINETSANFLHVDLTDGTFAGEKNFSIETLSELLKLSKKDLDIHLMVSNPLSYLEDIIKLNPKRVAVHLESKNVYECLKLLKEHNILAGLAINPNTDNFMLKPFISYLDYVLVMSVNPGFGGQQFLDFIPDKLKTLKSIIKNDIDITIDGGINDRTIMNVKDYVTTVVSGSYICLSSNYEEKIRSLK